MKQSKENKARNIVRVNLNGEITYMTSAAYAEFRLQLSTGDFHVHKAVRLKKLPKSVPTYKVREAVDFNPRIKYPTVELIIEAYRDADQSAEEYSESEESPLAEFVSSFCYGEIDISQIIDHARFADETVELLKAHWNRFGRKTTLDLLESVSELQLGDIYYRDGEICSGVIGEQEHQVDETLAEAYQTLSPEEKLRVQRESGAGIISSSQDNGRFIYTSDDYSRWIMIADEEALTRKLKRALKGAVSLKAVSHE